MESRKLIHHILISVGILFGVTITGSTINAKAMQTNYTNYNNPNTNQNAYNNGQSYQPSANLINQSEYNNYQYNQYNQYNQDNQNQNQNNLTSQDVNNKSNHIYNHILKSSIHKNHHHKKNPNKLSKNELKARNWISWQESNHEWDVQNNQSGCIGYFQLDPHYLGEKNGHINLNKEHQVHVANAYVQNRYGSWTNAKKFWEANHYY